MRVQLDVQAVIGASTQFWEQMLGMPLEAAPIYCEVDAAEQCLTASVGIAGAWTGRIEVRMTEKLAWCATAAMMMQPLETVAAEDALDAAREIANMVAGTIKSSLPRPCTMTVPEAAIATGDLCGYSDESNTLSLGFNHAEGRLIVRICELECAEPERSSAVTHGLGAAMRLCFDL
jgi:CheY-specific phosphatase CheX